MEFEEVGYWGSDEHWGIEVDLQSRDNRRFPQKD